MVDQRHKPNQPDEPDDLYPVAPPDPELLDCRPSVYPAPHEEPPQPEHEPFQFTLAELLLLVAGVAFFLGVLRLIPGGFVPANLAGLAGLGALLSLVVFAVLKPTRPIIRLGWSVMVVIYILACIVAVIVG